MTNTEAKPKRKWWKEGLIGLGAGAFFGATSVAIGQPFDTIKTKMQVQKGFEANTMRQTITKTLESLGKQGFYRGYTYPFIGSTVYRSAQFGAYEAIYSHLSNKFDENGLLIKYRFHALLGGLGSATTRALIETPLEYAKIHKQTQRNWQLRHVYTGFGISWARTAIFLTTFFYTRDIVKASYPEVFSRPVLGPLITGSVVASIAWGIAWPLEVVKSQVQGSYAKTGEKVSAMEFLKCNYYEKGLSGLYRGLAPGLLRSFWANGVGLVVYEYVQCWLQG